MSLQHDAVHTRLQPTSTHVHDIDGAQETNIPNLCCIPRVPAVNQHAQFVRSLQPLQTGTPLCVMHACRIDHAPPVTGGIILYEKGSAGVAANVKEVRRQAQLML
jgi:hypothetical protein